MKSKLPRPFFTVWLALTLALLPVLPTAGFAQPAEPKPETAPGTPVVAAPPAPADKAPEVTPAAAPAVAAPEVEKPAAEKPAAEAATDDKAVTAEDTEKKATEPEQPAASEKNPKRLRTINTGSHRRHNSNNERVSVGHDSTLAEGEQADTVVSIFGSSTSAGEVGDAVVSVFGSSTSSGNVGGAVVSVVGNTHVTGGTVGDGAVAVMGSAYINAHIKGEVVAVLGNIELGPDAVVDGEIVCVGGEVTRHPKAVVHGNVQNVAVGGRHFNFEGLTAWVTQCLLYARPLAFGPHLMWAWWIALACLAFYTVIALVAPGAVVKCAQTLEERPGKSILTGVLTLVLTPVAYLLLFLTVVIVIGVVLIPVFSMGLFFAAIFGKVVMLAWVGRRVTKLIGAGPMTHPVMAVLIGGVIVLGLYTVPVVGFIVYKLMGVLGLGVVIYTMILTSQSNRAAAAAATAARLAAAAPVATGDTEGGSPPVMAVASLPAVVSAATLPRAGFWIRVGAALLDFIMLGIITGMSEGLFRAFDFHPGRALLLWVAIYHVIMWATKGTTIGGIICGLKLVRVDDRPVDWGVAIVRSMSAFLSFVVAGLGFMWVAFDDEKQSWHDKIAGTTIVRVPKGTSLL